MWLQLLASYCSGDKKGKIYKELSLLKIEKLRCLFHCYSDTESACNCSMESHMKIRRQSSYKKGIESLAQTQIF